MTAGALRAGGSCLTLGLDPGLRPVLARNLRVRPGRSALTMFAVSLGVAVMLGVQVDIAGVNAQAQAAASLRAGASGLDVRAAAQTGLTPSELATLGSLPGVRDVVPLYQKRVVAQAEEDGSSPTTVTVVGIDDGGAALRFIPLAAGHLPAPSSRDQIAIDARLLDALAPPGGSLALGRAVLLTTGTGPQVFRIVGLTRAGGVAASFTQQAVFLPRGELLSAFKLGLHTSLAALRLAPGATPAQVAAEVRQHLGAVTTFDPTADSAAPLSQLDPLLILVSVLSVVIGAGVAANTVSLAAMERRRDHGLLRAAGVPAAQVFRLLTAEALLLALAGSAIGVGAGVALGAALQAAFNGAALPTVPLQVSPVVAALTFLAGTAAATLAAAIPAALAARVPIREALTAEATVRRERLHLVALGAIPPLLALTALGDLGSSAAVAAGAVALLLAVDLALPLLAPGLTALLGRLLGRLWPEGELAAASLRRRRNRTALTLAGLVTAVAGAVGASILVAGSLAAGDTWVSHLFLGDTLVRSAVTQPPDIASQISNAASVQVTSLRFFPAVVDSDVMGMAAIDSRLQGRDGALDLVAGSRSTAFEALASQPALLAPESLAEADDWQVGSALPVVGAKGTVTFTVAGIVAHSFPAPDGRESLLIDAREATRVFGATASGFDDLEVLTRGHAPEVAQVATQYGLAAIPVSAIEASVHSALGDSIGILPAISWVALAIAMLAVINTLTVTVRNGRRELALLRTVGLSAAQARRFVLAQAGFLGTAAGLLGALVGCLLAVPMLQVSRSPGFVPAFDLPWLSVLTVAAAVVLGAMAAALIPARWAARADIVSAVRHE